jgi:DNA-binding PadR family transcriptional regulator
VKAGTKYAVLGLLREQPSYGYELLVRFRRTFDAAQWGISPQGLYASLDRLERDGLIAPVAARDRDARRQPRTPYRVTPSGAAELRDFLDTPMGAEPSRAELLVRLQCAGMDETDGLLRLLDGHERACLDELGRVGRTPDASAVADGTLLERLASEERRLGIQARLLWIGYARRLLRDGTHEPRRRRRPKRGGAPGS